MVARSAAQKRASLTNLAKARAAVRGRTSTAHNARRTAGTTAKAVTVSHNPGGVRYRKPRLRKVRIKL